MIAGRYEQGKVIGQGAFGQVVTAKDIETGRQVAIKIVVQEEVAKLGKHRHVFREKDLLFEMDNQFIIKLLGTKMVRVIRN